MKMSLLFCFCQYLHTTFVHSIQTGVPDSFAPIEPQLKTIKQLLYCKDKKVFDLAALVVNVGQYERVREVFNSNTSGSSSSGSSASSSQQQQVRYSMFKTLTLIDSSCDRKFTVTVFTNSRKTSLDKVQVGQIVLLTDLTLHSISFDSLVMNRYTYAKSTPLTQVYTIESEDEPIMQTMNATAVALQEEKNEARLKQRQQVKIKKQKRRQELMANGEQVSEDDDTPTEDENELENSNSTSSITAATVEYLISLLAWSAEKEEFVVMFETNQLSKVAKPLPQLYSCASTQMFYPGIQWLFFK